MNYFINERVLIQMECKLNENGHFLYRIVTFFRFTHKVHETRFYNYERALKLYQEMCKTYFN